MSIFVSVDTFQIWYATHSLCFIAFVVWSVTFDDAIAGERESENKKKEQLKWISIFIYISLGPIIFVCLYAHVICVFRANFIQSVNMSE